ncbi:S-adenosyl-L-methionine-dependent methyltransferase [Lecanosticta acicola]|uniref:S-adenosyl-L-methionine-dependent methyltransferase n=1 Tax=Lecanosticta acicola TaxID=111012 RepID=A0AAI8YPE4_9PEZI|nr:S-adenosyl-L-methionine-dependent methyltransferase [Lecanosticta acicola]
MPRGKRGGGRFNRGGKGGRGRSGGGGGGGGHRQYQERLSFDQVPKNNEKLERFYNTLGIIPDGDERAAFWATLRRELPNSFRFTGSKGHALAVRENLVQRYFPLIKEITHDGRPVKLPTEMPWYPNGLAYRMDTPKNVVRKYEHFKEFQKFLVSETGVGNISRQEEVSMIPPFLLDVQPQHTVLDLCAAPGSKSAQLIEMIHAGEEDRVAQAIARANNGEPTAEDDGRATGMLIANDMNYKRAQMLVHQVKRLNSPNLVVTCHDATMFPSIKLLSEEKQTKGKYLKFDRILADVPCSGDGTCRKNPSIWKEWTPQNGLGLYQTQVRILTRALQMLKVGGRVVYSTCSMNPVEDEAVIASAIERCGGVDKVKLVDCSDMLPGLVRSPGLTDWKVMARGGEIYESWAEARQFEEAKEGSRIVPGMFPPEPEERIPLERCWRVYPHQQDTGGFFIVALEKQSEIKAKPENESKSVNKNWQFVPPVAAPIQAEKAPDGEAVPSSTDFDKTLEEIATGNTDKATVVPDAPSGNTTAAQRQNTLDDGVAAAGTKRAAPEDQSAPSSAKKAKVSEEGVAISVDVKDAVSEAPFEKTIPHQAMQPLARRKDDPTEESFKYLTAEHPELLSIYKFYELHPSFPRDRFLVRNPAGDPVKGIYYTSQLVKEILRQNEKSGMKFVHAGVKMFMKQDAQGQNICAWRIQTEGLPIIEGWVGEGRVVRLRQKKTLRKLLVEMFPRILTEKHEDGSESGGWKDLGEIGEQVKGMGMGCCVMRVQPAPELGDEGFSEPLTLPLWRSMHSVNLMLPKEDRKAMLLRIFNEDIELINHADNKKAGAHQDQNGSTKGSIPAEDVAREVEEKNMRDGDEDDAGGVAPNGAIDPVSGLPVSGEGGVALEQKAMHAEDEVEAKRLEVLEDEERKVAEAMPEREGEGDDYNATV